MTDAAFAKLIAWLQLNNLEAITTARDPLVVRRRRPKHSRLTGERR